MNVLSEFYTLNTRISNNPICVTSDKVNMDNYQSLISGNIEVFNFPIVFKQTSGKKYTDILESTTGSTLVVSDKLIKLLKENNITGWKTYPTIIYDKYGEEIKGYNGFSITGKCGATDYSKSRIIQKRFVENGPLVDIYLGKHIGLYSWDGSDIFIEEGTLFFIITKKVADILKKNKITNYEVINLADFEINVATIELMCYNCD